MTGWMVLPPNEKKCPICAVEHHVDAPHDATTFFYRFLFKNQYGRDATWNDALLHCPEDIRNFWTSKLTAIGIDVNSTQLLGDIKSHQDFELRFKKAMELD